jgi:hypothetical protein
MAFGTVKADALQTDSRIIGVDEIVGLEPNVVPALGDSVFWDGTKWVAASGGTITSAALQVPSGLAVAGSPIVSSGTFAVTYASGHQAYTTAEAVKLAGVASGATANTGTVTSAGLTVPSGLVAAGSPIVSSGTFVVTYASGHQSYTTAEANKLATIASGAEVNVNADWTAPSGDAFILNKPLLGTAAALNVGTSSGNVVQLDSLAKLPAVDGSQLTGINSTTDLSYDTSTRFLDSSTGSGVTLPTFASGIDGFVPAASGGTTSFLREDGTWQPVMGSTNLSYDDSTRVLSSSTGSGVTLPVFASGVAGLVPATSSGGTTTFLRADGEFATAGSPPGGSDTQVQFNDGGIFGGDADLTYNKTTNKLTAGGDVELNDGGTFTTTLQTVTPTANRTISFPDATGTIGLVAGSSGQLLYNNAGVNAGLSTVTTDGTNVTLTGRFISSLNGAASAPPGTFTGTWFTGGTSTTTKPQVVIEPTGTTSTSWSTSGTGLGVNAASGFAGNLLDLQVNGTSRFAVTSAGYNIGAGPTFTATGAVTFNTSGTGAAFSFNQSVTASSFRSNNFGTSRNSANGIVTTFGGEDIGFGTDLTGGDCSVRGGNGRGAGNSGSIIFSTGLGGASGGTANTATERFRVNPAGELVAAEAGNIVVGTTTGTKIGTATTQKLGFFGVTPVVQQTELTDELTTITHTAPGTADFAIQNLSLTGYGFVTEDEGNTVLSVIANLQARVNELETKLVALGFLADAD